MNNHNPWHDCYPDPPDRRSEPDDPVPDFDEDEAYEKDRQREIDEQIESGDHLLDERKENALIESLKDITRSLNPL